MIFIKSAIISAIILSIIITLLIINSFALEKCASKLLDAVNRMSDNPKAEQINAAELEKLWKKLEPFVSISVVHLETEVVTNAASLIRVYSLCEDKNEFIAAKELFTLAVEHISFSGRLSFETIL